MKDAVAIAQVGPDPAGRGGMAAVTRGLLSSSLRERYRMTAIVTYRAGSAGKGIPVFAAGLVRLTAWSLTNRTGIVHVHSAVRGSAYRKAIVVGVARLLGMRVILQVHAGPGDIDDFVEKLRSHPFTLRVLRTAFAKATRVVTVSKEGAAALKRDLYRGDATVVPNAAPEVEWQPPSAVGPCVVLYLGGFDDPAKGGAVLLRALPTLLAGQRDLRLVLAGPGEAPPAAAALEGDRVHFSGWLDADAKGDAFRGASIVVLPSISEGMPIALLEAMAHGRAIVASSVGGMPDMLVDGEEALLVPPGDELQLADAIARLAESPSLREALGTAARARVARVGEPHVNATIDKLYTEVAAT